MRPTVTLIPARERVVPERRKPLTTVQRTYLLLKQDGICGCGCGQSLFAKPGTVIDEHVIPLALGGSNALSNRSLWRKPCSDAKTYGKSGDLARTAKAKRQAGETCNGPKRKIPHPAKTNWPTRTFPKRAMR